MNPLFQRLMRSAARLTGKGDLHAATAAIQQALAGRHAPMPPPGEAGRPSPADVIDVAAREVAAHAPAANDSPLADAPAAPPEASPAPLGQEQFIAGRYAHPVLGQREYKLYIPPQAASGPLPLVVMLHGCTQDADDFASGTAMNSLARAQGFLVLYPEQSPRFNPNRCWNWFKHNHQGRDHGEPGLIAGMARQVMAQQAIDPARVYVAGLSAGGAMAAILGDAYPDLFAAVGVHSGLATGTARDVTSAFSAMKSAPAKPPATSSGVPTIVFHGDGDTTVHPGNGDYVIAASVRQGARVEVEKGVAPGGRTYTRQSHRQDGGAVVAEHWVVHGSPHAWSGGRTDGSYTDPAGPDASREMMRFFLAHRRR